MTPGSLIVITLICIIAVSWCGYKEWQEDKRKEREEAYIKGCNRVRLHRLREEQQESDRRDEYFDHKVG